VEAPARLKIAVASEDSITCWRRYRIRVTLNAKNFLNGWVKTSIRKSSPARRSTGYCTEEKGGRLDLQDKNASELCLLAASTDAPGSPHTGLTKGHRRM